MNTICSFKSKNNLSAIRYDELADYIRLSFLFMIGYITFRFGLAIHSEPHVGAYIELLYYRSILSAYHVEAVNNAQSKAFDASIYV